MKTVNLQLLFNLNKAEMKRATLTGWSVCAVETSVPRLDDWSEMKPFGVVELVERSIAKSTKETTGCSDRRMSVIDCCPQSPAVSTGKA
ncbi:hypothetical protein T4B_12244 [Trichinella pseudospiralis]|uniref:Uncharacterized protein n=2 Tax=Trichinella pseudospiralis TaxID=6337 RepID=A0A0V1G418_TRIPS|nr:hypothetical protein T4A_6048 [Trichinella pseudospiralis]KRY93017.1 hypothetical protein T4D_11156 [Trichinella pseudospiralis]KRZ26606.1 hypothetical protein T4B_12244 [Trichinella pseudospiralis]KRZ41399.1 hypothetical protein T4C_13583 [Trichinella pseudospiralis]